MFSKWAKQDIVVTLCIAILLVFGLVAVYSTTLPFEADIEQNFVKHLGYTSLGVIIYIFLTAVKANSYKLPLTIFIFYTITIALLVYLLVSGTEIAGTKRWISLGVINIQPAEIAKLLLILLTATIWGREAKISLKSITQLGQPQSEKSLLPLLLLILTCVPIFLLVYLQRSLGNTVILITIWLILLTSRIRFKKTSILLLICFGAGYANFWLALPLLALAAFKLIPFSSKLLLAIVAAFTTGLLLSWGGAYVWDNYIDNYQKIRIATYLNPGSDPQGSGWQVARAKIAIAASPIPFGFGFLQGPQTNSQYLPFPYTDFIFASIVEQFGLLGGTILLIVYLVLLGRVVWIGLARENMIEQLIALGVAAMIFLNLVVHVGMNIGVLPVTGVPLPLVSYGGSSLLVTMAGLGLVQMIITDSEIKKGGSVSKLDFLAFSRKQTSVKIPKHEIRNN